jgi:threonine dehydrogenase-like Zn-dependent dehydrogenase
LEKIGICGNDDVLITGLGPVGLASAMLCRAMGAQRVYGIEVIDERISIAKNTGLFDELIKAGDDNVQQIQDITSGRCVEKSIDCSANNKARLACIQATRKWGKIVFIGEGGTCEFQPSRDIIHDQKTIYGSWVTNIWRMEELVERLVRWKLKPEMLITHRFELNKAADAYSLMASGKCGKVAVVFDEEIQK